MRSQLWQAQREGFARCSCNILSAPVRLAVALLMVMMLSGVGMTAETRGGSQVLSGTVKDSLGRPVAGAAVTLRAIDGRTVSRTSTDLRGEFRLPASQRGTFDLVARKTGFDPANAIVVLPDKAAKQIALVLGAKQALTLPVSASRIHSQNQLTATGVSKYTFTARDITNLPQGEATPLNQVLLQMPGVALDQNQEIHIRGEHAGIQYQMNGILLPLDINNDPTFTQLLNSYFVKSVSLVDGVLPAEYGYRTAGVIEISTKNGCDDAHNDFTMYGGQRNTAQPSFELGGCRGNFSYYLTGFYLHSNLGLSSATPGPDPFHDRTDQGQGFAYLTYEINPTTQLSLISGMTVASNQFPNQPGLPPMFTLEGADPANYPSADINSSVDQQNYYGVLALNGAMGANADYQVAYTILYNRENFNPDPTSDLIYQGVSPRIFDSDFSKAAQGNLTYHLGDAHTFRTGFYFGAYTVEADDTSQAFPIVMGTSETRPISITSNLNKISLI